MSAVGRRRCRGGRGARGARGPRSRSGAARAVAWKERRAGPRHAPTARPQGARVVDPARRRGVARLAQAGQGPLVPPARARAAVARRDELSQTQLDDLGQLLGDDQDLANLRATLGSLDLADVDRLLELLDGRREQLTGRRWRWAGASTPSGRRPLSSVTAPMRGSGRKSGPRLRMESSRSGPRQSPPSAPRPSPRAPAPVAT